MNPAHGYSQRFHLVPGTGPISRTGWTLHWVRQPAGLRQVLKHNAFRGETCLTMSPAGFASQHCSSILGKTEVRKPTNKPLKGNHSPIKPLPGEAGPAQVAYQGASALNCHRRKGTAWKPSHPHRSQGSGEDKGSKMQREVTSLACKCEVYSASTQCVYLS